MINKFISDTLRLPERISADSLNNWTKEMLTQNFSRNEAVYYDAIQWIELLYLTINNPKNIKKESKTKELVNQQLDNGSQMMERLSYYQDYTPISDFSNHLINIIDCKYFTFDVTQLNIEVIDVRDTLYNQNNHPQK